MTRGGGAGRAGVDGVGVGLMAGEVAGGAVPVGEELLEGLAGARVGVARIGAAVNSMAATGHLGGVVSEELLVGVLGRLAGRVEAAVAAAQAVGRRVLRRLRRWLAGRVRWKAEVGAARVRCRGGG